MAAPTQKPQGRKPRKARISQPAPKEAQLPQNAPDRFFALSAQGTSIATEFRAGLATFLTMAYIMFVNPDGLAARPPSLEPTFLKMNLSGAFNLGLVVIVLTLLLVTILDTAGTLIGVARQAGFLDAEGRLPRLRQALLADSGAAMLGAVLGTSTTTAYIESAAGVEEGGRTGLTALVVAALFLLEINAAVGVIAAAFLLKLIFA